MAKVLLMGQAGSSSLSLKGTKVRNVDYDQVHMLHNDDFSVLTTVLPSTSGTSDILGETRVEPSVFYAGKHTGHLAYPTPRVSLVSRAQDGRIAQL